MFGRLRLSKKTEGEPLFPRLVWAPARRIAHVRVRDGSWHLVPAEASQAGYVVRLVAWGQAVDVLLAGGAGVPGGDVVAWLPHAGWAAKELVDLGFLRVGSGRTERWVPPTSDVWP